MKDLHEEQENGEDAALVGKTKLDLDRILEDEVGSFGKYQFKVIYTSLWFVITVALTGDQYLFATARIPTRCVISECENISRTVAKEFAPSWLADAVPVSDTGTGFDTCHRFAPINNLTVSTASTNESCPANLFDNNTIVPCEGYVYEHQDTVVYDFGLACQEWSRSMIGSARTLGWLFSHPLTGFISDRWGRRTALAFNAFNSAWIGLTRYFAYSYIPYVISELSESILGGGAYACVYILLMEIVGPKQRVIVGALCATGGSIGHFLVAGIAWAVPYWRNFILAIYVPQILLFPLIWLLAESLRWLMSQGQYEKAEDILKDIARTNGTQISTNTIMALKNAVREEKAQITAKKTKEEETWLVVLVFRHKPVLVRCLVSTVLWITLILIFYGLLINSVNLQAGSKVFNYLAVSLSEVPGYWTACLLVNRIGRKPVLAGGYFLCAFAMITYIFVPIAYKKLALALYMVGKFSISWVATTLYLYTTELYPTQYRHRLVAFCSTMGRFGSLLAPLTPAFGGNIAFLLFSSLAVVSGLLVLMLPETLGCKLPDTMQEAANLGKSRGSSKAADNLELK